MSFTYALIILARPYQWYKNLLIIMPLFFSMRLFEGPVWPWFVLGFLTLCLISSAGYIFNDIIDAEADRKNPEKANRPLASGKISAPSAFIFGVFLVGASFLLASTINIYFLLLVSAIFISTLLYSFILKNEMFADLLSISLNFVLRTVSGSVILQIAISPWLIICVFFLALFLTVTKRYSEVLFLGEDAGPHRKVLLQYTPTMLSLLLTLSISTLVVTFSIFTLFSEFSKNLIYLLPLFVYIILRYAWLVRKGSIIPRHPHLLYQDKRLFFSMLIFIFLSIILIYTKVGIFI